MGERLTAEREAAYRKAAARLDVREVHTAEVEAERFAAMTLLLVGVNDLLAELDAVRAERDEARRQRDHSMGVIDEAIDAMPAEGHDGLAESVRQLRARAERAEEGLAVLREAVARWRDTPRRPECDLGTCGACGVCLLVELRRALTDTAAAAEAYARSVEAKALEEAADRIDAGKCRECAAVVRAMADEIRGGR